MWFVAIASTYTVLSLLGPVFASHTELATKVVLGFAHVIAAVIAIPLIAASMVQTKREPQAELHLFIPGRGLTEIQPSSQKAAM